uniref:NADH dehydrogenase subunit 2 n=1 Tax=Schistosoma japonicum TaxID=6182 RepID=A0A0D3L3A4_SCHJA|nr:NADH dehydrogenase subunit 2 [Schistosoma japonicum]
MLYSFLAITILLSLCVTLVFSGDLLTFWLLLELCSIVVIPCFYWNDNISALSQVDGLLYYLLATSISSSLILVGILFPGIFFFFFLVFFLKFGVFPFIFWVYQVFTSSKSWIICWCISTVLKFPVLYISFFVGQFNISLAIFLSSLGILISGVLVWVNSINWFAVWCYMMVSSSNVIVCLSVDCSFFNLLIVYLVYFIWSSGVIFYLSSFYGGVFGYVVWLIAIPLSFALYYKIYVSYLLIGLGWVFVFFWVLYSFLEQFYLFKWLVSSTVPKSTWWGRGKILF